MRVMDGFMGYTKGGYVVDVSITVECSSVSTELAVAFCQRAKVLLDELLRASLPEKEGHDRQRHASDEL